MYKALLVLTLLASLVLSSFARAQEESTAAAKTAAKTATNTQSETKDSASKESTADKSTKKDAQKDVKKPANKTAKKKPRQKNEIITIESTISGSLEQPKILTIVPWQKPEGAADITTSSDPEANNVFLQPVERKPFLRKTRLIKTVLDIESAKAAQ